MSRAASIFSAILTALLGMFGAGFIAALAVDWYNIPGREGESGYFVVSLALLGFAVGLVIGLIVARVVAAGARPSFSRSLATSLTIVTVIGLASGGLARALADVPPTLDGETLLLAVEVRWPPTQIEAPVAVGSDEASVSLHSLPHFSHTVRASERGPLWMEDAHRVDGRWVVPGAVQVFTSRGRRMLSVGTGEKNLQGFQVPLPAFPGRKDLEWSDWLPRYPGGVSVPADRLSYRYRVRKASQPIRTEIVGPFEIATIATSFYAVQQDKRTLNGAFANFSGRYRGEPLVIDAKVSRTSDSTKRFDRFDNVALVAGTRPAFVMAVGSSGGTGHCYFVTENRDRPRIEYVDECGIETTGRRLTSDTALFHAANKRKPVRGRIDRISYSDPGLYRLDLAVLDTRRLVVRHFKSDSTVNNNPYLAPFGLSPDERSFVTYATSNDSPPAPLLVITDVVADRTYTLPIDPARMRYAKLESLDPAWLEHHFVWQRSREGVDRLTERAHFAPLPYRGEVTVETSGNRTYRLEKGTEPLRAALIEFLVKEFNATRLPADSGAFEMPVSIDRRKVNVAFSSGSNYVAVSLDRSSTGDSTLVATIAERFDAALATGRYDRLFAK